MIVEDDILYTLCQFYQYQLDVNEPVIFAIRGCLPDAALSGHFKAITRFHRSHSLTCGPVNYQTPRCTIGLWSRRQKKIALFPGSTLPSKTYLFANASSLDTFNILCPGKYVLRRGIHPRHPGFQNHEALLMDGYGIVKIPEVKKGKTTVQFIGGRYSVLLPGDNLHAARTEPVTASCLETLKLRYSSSGCITITGQPAAYVANRPADAEWNCWQHFMSLLEKAGQGRTHFNFLLFNAADLRRKFRYNNNRPLRYGSQSRDVLRVQQVLSRVIQSKTGALYYTGEITDRFEQPAAAAYLNFVQDFTPKKISPEIKPDQFFSHTKHFYSSLKQA